MNDIKIFENEKFGKVRTAGTSSNPLFCLADVCRVLELQTSAVMRRLDDGVITSHPIQDNLGRTQQANFVNEDGLYDVILDSRKPEAKAFRKWITSEVLPSIRRTGQYNIASCHAASYQIEDPIKRAEKWIEEEKERQRLLLENQQKEQLLIEQEPKVNFADAMTASSTSCLVGELAKVITQNGYEIGQNRLFKWLRDNGYLGKWGERKNIPLQQYIEQGLFQLKKSTWQDNNNVTHTSTTVKVTGKGQQYFINKFLNNKNK